MIQAVFEGLSLDEFISITVVFQQTRKLDIYKLVVLPSNNVNSLFWFSQ